MQPLVARMWPYQASVFSEMSTLAAALGAVNLGQGFPDTDGPEPLKRIAMRAIEDGSGNQYPPRHGLPELLDAACAHQRAWYGLDYEPSTEAVIGTGASELLAAAVLALVEPGDEVIVLEPWFDIYPAAVALAGARAVPVPLTRSGDRFGLDVPAIRSAITPRTRALLLNTPHNPTATVFTEAELTELATEVIDQDILVISDEVYEHLVYPPAVHLPIARLPGMRERTVTIGSGGKSFSFTGWKVGWAAGPADLIAAVRVVRQHLSYVSSGPFQPAIAAGLRFPRSYFTEFATDLHRRRELLAGGLRDLGMHVYDTEGTYFVLTDSQALGWDSGAEFVNHLAHEAGVVAIPVAPFSTGRFDSLVRWTFCKRDHVLATALDQLRRADLANHGVNRRQ
ncbi:MAG: N-succinyldiaminopimelate aminotransferase [Actinomycetota bacterium]|nr:N-succinyldiaminopimelate aminotransferase [Actinomycetota bacterium]